MILAPDLHSNDALSRRGNARLNWNRCRDSRTVLQALESGGREDDRIEVAGVDLAQPRIEVASDWEKCRTRDHARQLGDSADAAGPDAW